MTRKNADEIIQVHPEMISIWETALEKGELRVKLDTKREAISLRQRLYTARNSLLALKYPNAVQFKRLEISINPETNELIIRIPNWLHAVNKGIEEAGGGGGGPTATTGQGLPTSPEEDLPPADNLEETIHELYGKDD